MANPQWHRTASHVGGDAIVYISEVYPNDWLDVSSARNYIELGVFDREGLTFTNPTSTSVQCLTDDRDDPFDEVLRDATATFSVKFKELGYLHDSIFAGRAPENLTYDDSTDNDITIKTGVLTESVPEWNVKIEIPMRVSGKYKTWIFPKTKIKLDSSSQQDYSRGKYTDVMVNFAAEYDSTAACTFYLEIDDNYTAAAGTADSGTAYTFVDADGYNAAALQTAGWPAWTYAADNALAGMLFKVLNDNAVDVADITGEIRVVSANALTSGTLTFACALSDAVAASDTGELIYSLSA